ncbi:sensor histidine kinase [Viridibacillus sp. YIM B01967]|uniref:Sensor histidine kinase n=1 Tax=Viridibacillus soli TaxID=2798301 RepID=A0ABS1H7Y9_9BACL|nr:sensor histidine kinase [Viridibacillus soli]MBK3495526.1 sensor histidine kinase [Viridibacillus soli]
MRSLIPRFLSILFIEIAIVFFIFFILWGMPKLSSWSPLWKLYYWELPLGLWILTLLAIFSISVAIWSVSLAQNKERELATVLQTLVQTDKTTSISTKNLSKNIRKSIESAEELILTQRKSLQRITNERAEADDKVIQERIIQERQRLARELHDSVSQQLFAASMLLSTVNETIPEDLPEHMTKPLKQTETIVQQAQLEMRALLLHLRPAALHNKSLAQGLEDLLLELKQKVFFSIHHRLEEVSLQKGAEDHLFRIAQETLSNTLRHAKATEVDILLVERDNLAIFRVQDNGVGFQNNDGKAGSYGLKNIEERAIEIGGTCKIVSIPNQGTVIEVKIPVEMEHELDDSNIISG